MKMDLDIIITYNQYNQSNFIAQAMDGLLLQKLRDDINVNVIVADDSSTDDTLEIIHHYEQKMPYSFTYIPNNRNLGHVLNYRRAFEKCSGD